MNSPNDPRIAQLNLPPGMIDFGVGQPSPALLPLGLLKEATASRLDKNDPSFLAYGTNQGDGYFRAALAAFLGKHYHTPVDSDQLLVTSGASMGLDLICTLFAKPGDTIFVEEPSYFLALRIFADHHLKIISLPMDSGGLNIEALEEKLIRHRPVFLYTIPTFHNPSSITLRADRRQQLVEISRKHNFLIIADEVYHLLNYGPEPPPPVASFIDSNTVLSLGSFSKILAPGLRLGWIQAGPRLLKQIVDCGLLDSGGGLNPFTSAVVRSAIEMGLQQSQLETLRATYTERKGALCNALKECLPESVRFIEPDGGFFIWLVFPEGVDTKRMLIEARQKNVGFLPGVKFSSRSGLNNYARLSFSYFDMPELEEGARRLAEVFKAHMNDK
ncbi:PLP-dependent aminotransferase family protein [Thermodesulfobacteriota bacterium]